MGTGFDRELTARENVFLNGALLGYSRSFLKEKYPDIVRFAELEGFMEQKIKTSLQAWFPDWDLQWPPPGKIRGS